MVEAVIWDFGGVLTSSPFEAFARYELERSLPKDFIRGINATNPNTNAWALFERSECTLDEFDELFAKEAIALGHDVRGRAIVELLSGDIRPEMVKALKACKARVKVGCITNNVSAGEGAGMARGAGKARAVAEVMGLFDHVIESSKIGMRKPDPRIYALACETLGVSPTACVYLDDLGINLKPAAALGMKTIKVIDPAVALKELEAAVGFPVG
ncbi:MAG TPA: HAD-IA family hydrolase [Parvibaculum sp.]